MLTIIWGMGLSEDCRETFDSVEEARAMLERSSNPSADELDHLFEIGKFVVEKNGAWIVVE